MAQWINREVLRDSSGSLKSCDWEEVYNERHFYSRMPKAWLQISVMEICEMSDKSRIVLLNSNTGGRPDWYHETANTRNQKKKKKESVLQKSNSISLQPSKSPIRRGKKKRKRWGNLQDIALDPQRLRLTTGSIKKEIKQLLRALSFFPSPTFPRNLRYWMSYRKWNTYKRFSGIL